MLCAAACATAATARADAPPAGGTTLTWSEWWAQPGGPGWTPDAAWMGGLPWTFAGLTAGGWELHDPLAPATLPAPGIPEAQAPLAWYDSTAVTIGGGGAWRGFGAGLVYADGIQHPPGTRKPRAVWTLVNGGSALERNGLLVTRGDERSWLSVGTVSGHRGSVGDMGIAGDHFWTINAGTRRGASTFDADFAQRGLGQTQTIGLAEGARGQSGALGWRWSTTAWRASARLSRGFDGRDDFASSGLDFRYARRDAQQGRIEATIAHTGADGAEEALRVQFDDGRVVRTTHELDSTTTRRDWRQRSQWIAARIRRPEGSGMLELAMGAGHDDVATPTVGRFSLAPSLSWELNRADSHARIFAERLVDPIWSDLAAGHAPFVQDTWAGGIEAGAGGPKAARAAHGMLLIGRVGDRARLFRFPVRDFVLEQFGWEHSGGRSNFALASADGRTNWRALTFDARGYTMVRTRSAGERIVDPLAGARAGVEGGFHAFANDLGVRVRGEGAYVGARESDQGFVDPGSGLPVLDDVRLPGYFTGTAVVRLDVGDAHMEFRVDGIEGIRRPMTWLDLGSPVDPNSGVPNYRLARDAGRTFRFSFIWPLFN